MQSYKIIHSSLFLVRIFFVILCEKKLKLTNTRMKNILIIGSTGQIGSELTMHLRNLYGNEHVVAGYIPGAEPKGELLESGPCALADVIKAESIADAVKEIARENKCAVFTPSSIGSFGLETPHDMTPQDTVQRPRTIYGVSKVTTELLSEWFYHKYGVDTRSVRFPGIISYVTPPGGGTTDYAVDIYYYAVRGERFTCPIKAGTYMDMMYMPDALHAATMLMEADPSRLVHRNGFNIAAMSFDPEMIYKAIKKYKPEFEMVYDVDPLKQSIAESWPNMMDDSCARREWDWEHKYNLDDMTKDMLEKLTKKLL